MLRYLKPTKLLRGFILVIRILNLFLDSNKIGNGGAMAIAEFLIKGEGGLEVIDLGRNPQIDQHIIGFNDIGEEGTTAIIESLRENKHIASINLCNNA